MKWAKQKTCWGSESERLWGVKITLRGGCRSNSSFACRSWRKKKIVRRIEKTVGLIFSIIDVWAIGYKVHEEPRSFYNGVWFSINFDEKYQNIKMGLQWRQARILEIFIFWMSLHQAILTTHEFSSPLLLGLALILGKINIHLLINVDEAERWEPCPLVQMRKQT